MKYPKINTIWKRDENNKYVIMEGDYSKEEFRNVNKWYITEKIDGTNIRVIFNRTLTLDGEVEFRGRTDKAEIPTFLLSYLKKIFTKKAFISSFEKDGQLPLKIILYGEGYGGKIQKIGMKYRETVAFILFDIWLDGWWLDQKNVVDIAFKLGVESVPLLGIMTKEEAINYLKSKPKSLISKEEMIMEGIVARSEPLMLFRNKNLLMWKLKTEDYEKLERFWHGGLPQSPVRDSKSKSNNNSKENKNIE